MNILIVDDDITIRNLLSMLIKQIDDFTGTVAGASSADEAEALCDERPVDLVITDIKMPNRSGLELIRLLRKKHPEIQIACLSAYDDYEYIRKALKLGVLDYILKSEMKLEDIISLLDKVESFSSISYNVVPPRDEVDNLREINTLLELYLEGDDAQAEEICMHMDCDMADQIAVIAFYLQRQAVSIDELLIAQRIAEKTREGEQRSGLSFVVYEGERIVMLLKDTSDSIESRENEMMKLSLLYKRNLEEYSDQSVAVSLYEVAQNAGQLRQTIMKVTDILDAYEYYPNYEKDKVSLKRLNEDDVRVLQQLMEDYDGHFDLQASADRFFEHIQCWHQDYMAPREVKSAAMCGLFYLMGRNDSFQTTPENLLNYNYYAKHIRYARDQHKLEGIVQDALESMFSKNYAEGRPRNDSVQAAVEYINVNYDHKLTLDDIAKHIYLNRTYVSQLFKKHMKVNFAEYLEMVRINKAKTLLLDTHMPIVEIAARVGYSNQSYFTKVFKRNTGFSPNAFRMISKK